MITFTIVTCTYNAAAVLQRTLDSVKSQTHPNVQHLILDGASEDATMDMVREYAASQPDRVLVVSEPDGGLYDAMNKGLALAKGDYLVFLNAGDKLHSVTTLTDLAAQLEVEATANRDMLPGVIYGQTDVVDEAGKFVSHRHLQAPDKLTWRSFKNGMLVCHQAFYVRTDIARRIKYNLRYRLSADVDWCIRVMKETERMGLKLYNSHLVLCDYLEGGMSVKSHRASLLERFSIMKKHYGMLTTMWQHIKFIKRNL